MGDMTIFRSQILTEYSDHKERLMSFVVEVGKVLANIRSGGLIECLTSVKGRQSAIHVARKAIKLMSVQREQMIDYRLKKQIWLDIKMN